MSVIEILFRDFETRQALLDLAKETDEFPCTYTEESTGRSWSGVGRLSDDRAAILMLADSGERLRIDLDKPLGFRRQAAK